MDEQGEIYFNEYSLDGLMEVAGLDSGLLADSLRKSLLQIESIDKQKVAAQNKIDRRREILEEQERRREIKLQEYRRADERYSASVNKLDTLRFNYRKLDRIETSRENLQNECVTRLGLLNDVYASEETTRHRVAILHAMRDILDEDVPIKYDVTSAVQDNTDIYYGNYTQSLSWSVKNFPIVVKGIDDRGQSIGEGYKTKTLFGPFYIEVKRLFNTASGSAYVETHISAGATAITRSDYPHPHVSQSGEICLGTSKSEILELMKVGDYVGVIQMVMHVLSSYNPRDPYHKLGRWEPTRFSATTCNQCEQPALFCDCVRDITNGCAVDKKFLNDCGASFQNCLIHHERRGPNGHGINGSPCIPRTQSQRVSSNRERVLREDVIALDQYLNNYLNNLPE